MVPPPHRAVPALSGAAESPGAIRVDRAAAGRIRSLLATRGRLAVLAARSAFAASRRLGVRFNTFRAFGVPGGTIDLPVLPFTPPPCSAPRPAPPSVWALRDQPQIREKFLGRGRQPATPGVVTTPNGFAERRGLVVTAGGDLVNDVMIDPEVFIRNPRVARFPPRVTEVDGRVLSLAHEWQSNYFHWLFDVIAGLAVAEQLQVEFDAVFISRQHTFQRDMVEAVGLPADRIIDASRHDTVRGRSISAVTNLRAFDHVPRWACDFLRERLAPSPSASTERLYVSRSDAPTRQVENEAEVIDLVRAHGFRVVTLGTMPFSEQARLFASASCVVAPHGAGLSNILFCPAGATVIELAPRRFVHGMFCEIAGHCDLEYVLVPAVGMDLITDHRNRYQKEDFQVDLPGLRSALAGLPGAPSSR